MTQDMRNWVRWVRILVDPNEEHRGFTLADLEFKAQPDVVEDEMYGTLPGDNNTQADGTRKVDDRAVSEFDA